jgi:hypothetical protein
MSNDDNNIETRQERRDKKLKKKRERLPKHSKNLIKIYRDAILKRLKGKGNSNKL